ncbi:hypothetical protein [Dactylosporangium sp. CA-233914]|uniref:hypothetical protein n=1 Tax=Dactylosporangium sp. CA-233914 TaxID=3239934 RepID=UPI003D8C3168
MVRHTIAPADGGFVVSALALLAARTLTGAMLRAVSIVAVRVAERTLSSAAPPTRWCSPRTRRACRGWETELS